MKFLLLVVVLFQSARAQSFVVGLPPKSAGTVNFAAYGLASQNFVASDPINIPAGSLLEVVSALGTNDGLIGLAVTAGGVSTYTDAKPVGQASTGFPLGVVVGPATVRFYHGTTEARIVGYRISGEAPTTSPAVVLPNDGSGNYRVELEASEDLTTWAAVLPGAYPTTAARRFFRVKLSKE